MSRGSRTYFIAGEVKISLYGFNYYNIIVFINRVLSKGCLNPKPVYAFNGHFCPMRKSS